jgi:hypothetical protein
MSMSYQPSSYQGQPGPVTGAVDERPVPHERAAIYTPSRRDSYQACCCPGTPAVIAVMPAANGLRAPTQLLLCGHHYRQ